MKSNWIEDSLYQQIKSVIPIVCVDCVIQHDDSILLVRRAFEPAKNEWWFVGGRLHKNESFENCAIRKCKEEVNLDVKISRQLCTRNLIFDSIHSPVIVYHVYSNSRNVVIDSTINRHCWLPVIELFKYNFKKYIIECISLIDKEFV